MRALTMFHQLTLHAFNCSIINQSINDLHQRTRTMYDHHKRYKAQLFGKLTLTDG